LNYQTIFFDLDHTLWDYDTNANETLLELYEAYELAARGLPSLASFQQKFHEVNEHLWYLYDRGLIDSTAIRQERFQKILQPFSIADEELVAKLSRDYLYNCPRKGGLLPGAIDTLEYLRTKYSLTLITNGFEEIQNMKLASADITRYFDHVITSQKAGAKKPAREIFEYALRLHGHDASKAIMVGDNLLTDIAGAKNALIDTVFFNPLNKEHQESVTHEIASLPQLQLIL
jgi:YjjG family noncanonical pyrimidine nucleotidase